MKKEVKGIGIWQMGREFSLELCLCPSSPAIPMMAMPLNHQKQIMVFNNGTASVCDLTELQVRAILGIASQERNSSKSQWWSNPERLSLQMPNGNAGFSIKKSLQRFLQRRNTRRIRSMYPYHKPRT
ncbi:uncharacterized protein LOC111447151 [Cucurbita moschata]|uniref:Uncharacterized protein LOC111447151 n=1 Tax=Cucurbita moschata TaxID=3662 RepID=A0A6J1FNU6_CUCMO|nr:uncharacterized protein LOC111447151 [Cucurbita moschata]XP_022941938.1 uncharacterized protein LOC111447151 [Cucurbita moschata]